MFKILLIVISLSIAFAEPTEDRVLTLQGWNQGNPFPFKMYSGYLSILGTTKNLHYVYLESQKNPFADPLLVWFSGGPGCSSMLGFAQEHGPYVIDDGTDFFRDNPSSWNKEVNMLYIESPAGVGYSYCLDQDECNNFNDNNTAVDNLKALLYFFEKKFPERKNNDLYLSGESFAGIFVPLLANEIDKYNTKWSGSPNVFKPKLKGFMVGNAITNQKYDSFPAYVEMGYWHGLYDTQMYNDIYENNCNSQFQYFDFDHEDLSDECRALAIRFYNLTENISVYNIYGKCWINPTESKYGQVQVGDTLKTYKKYATELDYTPWLKKKTPYLSQLGFTPPCAFGEPLIEFMNRQNVRRSLLIPDFVQAWNFCSDQVAQTYKYFRQGSEYVYRAFKDKGYRILFYSGNADGAVPTLGSLQWISNLYETVVEEWRPFMYGDNVGGYIEVRDGITFIAIHGAGHLAPQTNPEETYYGVFNWLFERSI